MTVAFAARPYHSGGLRIKMGVIKARVALSKCSVSFLAVGFLQAGFSYWHSLLQRYRLKTLHIPGLHRLL